MQLRVLPNALVCSFCCKYAFFGGYYVCMRPFSKASQSIICLRTETSMALCLQFPSYHPPNGENSSASVYRCIDHSIRASSRYPKVHFTDIQTVSMQAILAILCIDCPRENAQIYNRHENYVLPAALKSDHDPMKATRIGEAKNPGPFSKPKHFSMDRAVLAILNPTAIRKKQDEFANLMQSYDVNLFCCAETTATHEVQKEMTKQFAKLHLRTVWSTPVQPQKERTDNNPSLRGRAGGTAIMAKWPIRAALTTNFLPQHAPDRLTHAIVQLGTIFVQVLTIYGYAGSNSWHKQATNELMQTAIRMAGAINLPAIYVGDFNLDVHMLDAFDLLASQGYMSLQQLHEKMYAQEMPKTCKEATTPDTAVIHPCLIPRLAGIHVDPQGLFDAHNPVIVVLQVPHEPLFHKCLKTPKTWVDFPLDKQDIQKAAEITCKDVTPCDLQQWAELVENTVGHAIHVEHVNNPLATPHRLPKHCRGRCKPPRFVLLPMVSPAKMARQGEYQPPLECATYRGKKMLRQIRRLHALRLRLRKLDQIQTIPPKTIIELWQEWTAILRWQTDEKNFCQWANDIPELFPFPCQLPTQDWLNLAQQFMKHEFESHLHEEHRIRDQKAKIQHIIDCKEITSVVFLPKSGTMISDHFSMLKPRSKMMPSC